MKKVVVLIDWQNTYKQARKAFGLEREPDERGTVSPLGLAQILAARNKRSRHGLVRVEVHRGLPDPRKQRVGNASVLRQRDAWEAEAPGIVEAKLRPLAYNPDTGDPEEKGVDVAVAVSALEWTITGKADVVVIFSHDSDMLPGIEAISRLYGPDKIETGSWWSRENRYWNRIPERPNVTNHPLDEEKFLEIETPVDYRPPN